MQFTPAEIWQHMGAFSRFIFIVLGLMSLASLIVIAERVLVFVRSSGDSRSFAMKMARVLKDHDVATVSDQFHNQGTGHLGRVISAGLSAYRIASPSRDVVVESVARALERQAQREVQTLRRGLNVLATVSSTAPFVGLLGTVGGIVNSFQSMAVSGSGGLTTVSAGIAEALVTTGFGLFVAIPAVMAYNFLQGWVEARAVDMSESSNELLDLVARYHAGVTTPTAS